MGSLHKLCIGMTSTLFLLVGKERRGGEEGEGGGEEGEKEGKEEGR